LPPLNLYARVRIFACNLAHETAGAARTRHSLRPLISGVVAEARLGQIVPREREGASLAVIARSQRVRANARPDDRLRDDLSAVAQRAKAEAIQTASPEGLWIASLRSQ
jgi:hypothetical protein